MTGLCKKIKHKYGTLRKINKEKFCNINHSIYEKDIFDRKVCKPNIKSNFSISCE